MSHSHRPVSVIDPPTMQSPAKVRRTRIGKSTCACRLGNMAVSSAIWLVSKSSESATSPKSPEGSQPSLRQVGVPEGSTIRSLKEASKIALTESRLNRSLGRVAALLEFTFALGFRVRFLPKIRKSAGSSRRTRCRDPSSVPPQACATDPGMKRLNPAP